MAAACTSATLRARVGATAPIQQRQQHQAAAPLRAAVGSARHSSARRSPILAAALAEEPVAVVDEVDVKSLYEEFAVLLDQYDHNFKRGDMVVGTVFRVDERGAYVDIGAKGAGYCSSAECSLSPNAKVRHSGGLSR